MRNTDVCLLYLAKDQPITGITVHLLKEEYYEEVPISEQTLTACFLSKEAEANNTNPTQKGYKPTVEGSTPKQFLQNTESYLRHATSLLEASGLDPPGIRDKPSQEPSPEVSKTLLDQFDTKDIEQVWIPAYKQRIINNYNEFSLDKFDVGHTVRTVNDGFCRSISF